MLVAEDLDLDVSGPRDVLFDDHTVIFESFQ